MNVIYILQVVINVIECWNRKKKPENLYDKIIFTHKSYPSTVFLAMSLKWFISCWYRTTIEEPLGFPMPKMKNNIKINDKNNFLSTSFFWLNINLLLWGFNNIFNTRLPTV